MASHDSGQVTAVMGVMGVMTDPRMISGLEMLSSDEPSSEHSRVTGGSSVVTILTDVTPEPGHSSLSSSHVRPLSIGLSYRPLDWVRSLLSQAVSSVLSLSLTAHSSHSSA